MSEPVLDGLFSVSGRTACVTGASGGLGRACATVLARAGAQVVGVARRADALGQWCNEAGSRARAVAADLSVIENVADVARQVAAQFGPPDILLNGAGINPRKAADELGTKEWNATLNINLAAPFFLAQAMVPAMRRRGWGRIINFASLQSRRAFPKGAAYGASKGGIEQLTRAMAQEWSPYGVNVNAIAPGFFPTDLTRHVFADEDRSLRNARQTCVGRNGKLEDLTGPVLFLCSDASAYVTGQTIFVDGGFTAK